MAKDTQRLKERGWKKIFHANGTQKEAGAAVVISDKTDFKTKSLTQDKEGQPVDVWQNQYNIVKYLASN